MSVVLSGETPDGYRWSVSASYEGPNDLLTLLTVERNDQRSTAGFGGTPLYGDDVINSWSGQRTGTPAFVMVRAAPVVSAIEAVDVGGHSYSIPLSPVVPEFGLRFGALRIPDGATFAEVRPTVEGRANQSAMGQRLRWRPQW